MMRIQPRSILLMIALLSCHLLIAGTYAQKSIVETQSTPPSGQRQTASTLSNNRTTVTRSNAGSANGSVKPQAKAGSKTTGALDAADRSYNAGSANGSVQSQARASSKTTGDRKTSGLSAESPDSLGSGSLNSQTSGTIKPTVGGPVPRKASQGLEDSLEKLLQQAFNVTSTSTASKPPSSTHKSSAKFAGDSLNPGSDKFRELPSKQALVRSTTGTSGKNTTRTVKKKSKKVKKKTKLQPVALNEKPKMDVNASADEKNNSSILQDAWKPPVQALAEKTASLKDLDQAMNATNAQSADDPLRNSSNSTTDDASTDGTLKEKHKSKNDAPSDDKPRVETNLISSPVEVPLFDLSNAAEKKNVPKVLSSSTDSGKDLGGTLTSLSGYSSKALTKDVPSFAIRLVLPCAKKCQAGSDRDEFLKTFKADLTDMCGKKGTNMTTDQIKVLNILAQDNNTIVHFQVTPQDGMNTDSIVKLIKGVITDSSALDEATGDLKMADTDTLAVLSMDEDSSPLVSPETPPAPKQLDKGAIAGISVSVVVVVGVLALVGFMLHRKHQKSYLPKLEDIEHNSRHQNPQDLHYSQPTENPIYSLPRHPSVEFMQSSDSHVNRNPYPPPLSFAESNFSEDEKPGRAWNKSIVSNKFKSLFSNQRRSSIYTNNQAHKPTPSFHLNRPLTGQTEVSEIIFEEVKPHHQHSPANGTGYHPY